jgi:protein O-mannosyl-transferase
MGSEKTRHAARASRAGAGAHHTAEQPSAAMRASVLTALGLATFAVFAGVLGNGWVLFDDPEYVYENPLVLRGWTWEAARAFLSTPHGQNWHPLTSWSHMLDVQLFGLQPGAHHAVSLAFHVANALLVVLVLRRLTGAWWRSVIVGALFALHPLRVESVAWVAERKDVLSGFFFLLTLWAYARWASKPDRANGAWVMAALALGLMSKPMLVTLPCVLVLLDVWPLGRLAGGPEPARPRAPEDAPPRSLVGLVLEKWPLFALAAGSAVATYVVQRSAGAMVGGPMFTPAQRLGNALLSYGRYVLQTLWPSGLGVFYPYDRPLPLAMVGLAAVAIVAVSVIALGQSRARGWLATGWFWYLGTLVPVLGLVQVGGQAHADRYTYLPTLGLLLVIVWGLGEFGVRRSLVPATIAAAVVAIAALSVATVKQVEQWKDSRTLWEHALAVTRNNAVAHQGLGNALLEAGQVQKAVDQFEAAARIEPDLTDLQNTLGSALGMLGRYDEAGEHFRAALRAHETADGHHNLGLVLMARGRADLAIPEFESALRLRPDGRESHVQLGSALLERGRLAEAESHLKAALDLDARDADARRLLAETLRREGRPDEAARVE